VTGGNGPLDPDEVERRFHELSKEIAGKAGKANTGDEPRQGPLARRRSARGARGAQQQAGGMPQRAKRSRSSLRGWLAAVVILAIAGVLTYARLGGAAANPANDSKPVTHGAVPSLAPTSPSPAGPPADPFTGSPSDSYADGQAGIVLPAAHAIRGYSAAEVQAAYATTRMLLIAAELDPKTLRGGAPDALASLLIAQQRQFFVSGLDKIGVDKQGDPVSTRNWVTSFAPGTTTLIGPVIKVHGTMSASVGELDGRQALRVHVDYLFVYPVEPPGEPADWMRVVDRNYGDVDFAAWDDPGGALEPWLNQWNAGGIAGTRCDVNDGFVHPDYSSGSPDKVKPTGSPVNPYNQSAPPNQQGCRPTTGT
jgi:hypothetical protein